MISRGWILRVVAAARGKRGVDNAINSDHQASETPAAYFRARLILECRMGTADWLVNKINISDYSSAVLRYIRGPNLSRIKALCGSGMIERRRSRKKPRHPWNGKCAPPTTRQIKPPYSHACEKVVIALRCTWTIYGVYFDISSIKQFLGHINFHNDTLIVLVGGSESEDRDVLLDSLHVDFGLRVTFYCSKNSRYPGDFNRTWGRKSSMINHPSTSSMSRVKLDNGDARGSISSLNQEPGSSCSLFLSMGLTRSSRHALDRIRVDSCDI